MEKRSKVHSTVAVEIITRLEKNPDTTRVTFPLDRQKQHIDSTDSLLRRSEGYVQATRARAGQLKKDDSRGWRMFTMPAAVRGQPLAHVLRAVGRSWVHLCWF